MILDVKVLSYLKGCFIAPCVTFFLFLHYGRKLKVFLSLPLLSCVENKFSSKVSDFARGLS
jgi:hypothetical protein